MLHKRSLGAFEAKTHFSELLAEVAKGNEFTITRHGQNIAKLIPYVKDEQESAATTAIRAIKTLRKGIRLGKDLSIMQTRAEGRR